MPPAQEDASGPTPVDAIMHADKRTNIPPPTRRSSSTPRSRSRTSSATRATSLDPQLVWQGKDERDAERPRSPTRRRSTSRRRSTPASWSRTSAHTAKAGELEPELTLFESFDGLGELDLVDFYQHDANWSNRMILGDTLQVMASARRARERCAARSR